LSDSILIFVFWLIWFFCEKYDERRERSRKAAEEAKVEKGKKEERKPREA
jgi:hypothetical protein